MRSEKLHTKIQKICWAIEKTNVSPTKKKKRIAEVYEKYDYQESMSEPSSEELKKEEEETVVPLAKKPEPEAKKEVKISSERYNSVKMPANKKVAKQDSRRFTTIGVGLV